MVEGYSGLSFPPPLFQSLCVSALCPVKALKNMLAGTSTFPDLPLFHVPTYVSGNIFLTD